MPIRTTMALNRAQIVEQITKTDLSSVMEQALRKVIEVEGIDLDEMPSEEH